MLPLGFCSVRGCLDGLVLRTTLISGCVSKLTSGDFGRISTLSSSFVTSGGRAANCLAICTPNILEIGFYRGCRIPSTCLSQKTVSENRTHEPQSVTGPGWRTRRWTVCGQVACRPADSVPQRSIAGRGAWDFRTTDRLTTTNTREGFGGSL